MILLSLMSMAPSRVVAECQNSSQCASSNPCISGSCVNGVCQYQFNNNSCPDDGIECTFDYCINGSCAHPGRQAGVTCTPPPGSCGPYQCDYYGGNCVPINNQ